MTLDQEQDLLTKIQSDPKQFGVVFDQWYKPIFGYVFRRIGTHDVTADIVAETFLKAFLKIHSFKWQGVSISAWLYRIATNEVNQYARNNKYKPERLNSFLDIERVQFAIRPQIEVQAEELEKYTEFKRVKEKLLQLDLKYQEVIALRYFEKKDILEIAAILNKPDGTIKSLLSRGLEKLRTAMSKK